MCDLMSHTIDPKLAVRVVSFLHSNPHNRYSVNALSEEMGVHDMWGLNSVLTTLKSYNLVSQVATQINDGLCCWTYRSIDATGPERTIL